jgi:hypothetical protein
MSQKKFLQIGSLIILILSSVRGFLVYHFDIKPFFVYGFSAILLYIQSLLCIKYIYINPGFDKLKLLRSAIFYNYIFLTFFTIFYIIFVGNQEISLVYEFIVFPIIFFLLDASFQYIERSVHIITIIIIIGTFIFYNLGVLDGFEAISDGNLKLRPGELDYARIGKNYLPGGYLGNHHDNANILVMTAAFYFSKIFSIKKLNNFINFLLFILVTFFALLTGSASNIISLLIVIFLIILLFYKKILLLLIPFILFAYTLIQDKLYFLQKFTENQDELDSGGMYNSLNFNSILKSLHSILFGGGDYFRVPMLNSEVAFVKILIGIGIVPFLILLFILFSPLYYIYKFYKNSNIKLLNFKDNNFNHSKLKKYRNIIFKKMILSALPVLTGSITLLHYGSLFRITSIGLFCIFLTLFYKSYFILTNYFESKLKYNTSNF